MSATRSLNPDLPRDRGAALVFDDVVQEGGDRLVLVAAMLENERSHGHQVRDVRDVSALADLSPVGALGEGQGLAEAVGEKTCQSTVLPALLTSQSSLKASRNGNG
jgi:hypothetical protein